MWIEPRSRKGSGVVPDPPFFLHALDLRTIREKWRFNGGSVPYQPVVSKEAVFFFGIEGFQWHRHRFKSTLYAVDKDTGQEMWKLKTRDLVANPPVVWNDVVFYGSDGLYALKINSH